MTGRQVRLLVIALALFVVSALISHYGKIWHGYIDLQVYRNGPRVWMDGGELYGPMPPVYGIGLPFTYPPLAALFFAPLALMPLGVAEVLVLATSITALGVTLWVVLERLRPSVDRPTRLAIVIGAVAILQWLEPIRQTYGFGQINLVLMAAITLDCLVRKPFWPRGMLIGIAVSVKLTPAAYLLFFLLRLDYPPRGGWPRVSGWRRYLPRGDWKSPVTLVVSTMLAVGLVFVFFWHESVQYWFHTLSDTGRIGPPHFAGNQSWKGFAFRLGVSDSAATAIWLTLSVITIALAAIWMKRLLDAGHPVTALMVNAGAVLLVSPVSWSHHWVWIAPALVVAIDAILQGRRSRLFVGAVAFATILFAVGPQWVLPHDRDRELDWSWWQQILGSSYVLFTFAIFVIAVLTYHPTRTERPSEV
ncbi:glycosyltransferase 87 family protein [Nocardia sp. NPDC050406]|uniref:glycosyltransferase 87 family protein n=1 Tax=Nocardia sp. NPDC050406 TaxID=3364318 RepID=UPI003788A9DF